MGKPRRGPLVTTHRTPPPPFPDFLEANRRTVYRFLRVAVGPDEADDVFQETFLSALRAYPRVTDGSKLDRWVLRIASRKALDHHRRRGRTPTPVHEVPEGAAVTDLAAGVDPTADDPLWEAVRSLPPKQRTAVVHRYVLDRSYAEIADLMGGTQEAARANVSEGMRRLREVMR